MRLRALRARPDVAARTNAFAAGSVAVAREVFRGSRTPRRIAARERARSRQYGVTGALSAPRVARGKLASARTSGCQPICGRSNKTPAGGGRRAQHVYSGFSQSPMFFRKSTENGDVAFCRAEVAGGEAANQGGFGSPKAR